MSAIAEPPVTPPPAAPGAAPAAAPRPSSVLPTGVKIDSNYDPGVLYEKHIQEHKPPVRVPDQGPPAGVVPPPQPPPPPMKDGVQPPVPSAVPVVKKDDVASQLTSQFLPEGAQPPAPAAPPAPGPEANPEDRIQLTREASPAAHESFKAMRTVAGGLRDQLIARDRELTEARAEVDRLKSGAVSVETPEIVKLKQEHEAMSKRLMVVDLQSHPQFQQRFVAPRTAAEQEATAILAAHGVQADIEGLLNKNPVDFRKALSDVAAKLPTALDQADFANAMRTAHTLKQQGDQAVQNAGQLNHTMKQQTVEGHRRAFDEVYTRTVGGLRLAELRAPAGATPQEVAEVEAYNTGIRNLRTEAEKIALGTSDPQSIAAASLRAAAYDFHQARVMPMMLKVISGKDATIADLTAQLNGLRARNPNRDMRGIDGGGEGVDPSKMDNHQAADYWFNKK